MPGGTLDQALSKVTDQFPPRETSAGDRIKLAPLDYAARVSVPRHRHPRAEIIYMLSGEQTDDRGTYGAGTCVINRAGSTHGIKSPRGCRLVIYRREPVQFVADAM